MATLAEILKEEVFWYAGGGFDILAFALVNEEQQVYAVNVTDVPPRKRRAGVVVLARIEGDFIIIEEDATDRPLVKKLMAAGIPREKIILAYLDETIPEAAGG
jgi:XisI protein